jgi:hypothetical protein
MLKWVIEYERVINRRMELITEKGVLRGVLPGMKGHEGGQVKVFSAEELANGGHDVSQKACEGCSAW